MRAPIAIAFACLLAALAVAGCGRSQSDSTPVACLDGASAYLDALGRAPGEVRLGGETPISDCLAENQKAGDLATVGTTMVDRRRPSSTPKPEPSRVGPPTCGSATCSEPPSAGPTAPQGIHAELIRRLAVAARYSPDNRPLSPAFLSTYRQGYDAGNARG